MNTLRILCVLLVFVVVNVQAKTVFSDVKLTYIKPSKADATWHRVKAFTPRYPLALAKKNIAGCAVFSVTVDEQGNSQNMALMSSVPSRGIYKPAKKVIQSWQWLNSSNHSVKSEVKLIRLDFCLGGETQAEAQARCEVQSRLACGASAISISNAEKVQTSHDET